jgi:hypothetical protein
MLDIHFAQLQSSSFERFILLGDSLFMKVCNTLSIRTSQVAYFVINF